jgi:hypothetical protein
MCNINDNVTVKWKGIFRKSKLIDGVIIDIQTKERGDMFGDEYVEETIVIKMDKKIISIDNKTPKFLQNYEIVE